MRFHHYLRTAERIIREYAFATPLALFLRNFYRANRQMGSTDRKTVASLVYCYFRTKGLLDRFPLGDHLKAAWFLCHDRPTALLESLAPDWNRQAGLSAAEKLHLLEAGGMNIQPIRLFPFQDHLSTGIAGDRLALSLLQQPRLFLRLRPEKAPQIEKALEAQKVPFIRLTETCLSLDNSTKADELLASFSGDFEVQDYSSQRTGTYFRAASGEHWWDACAGSGGKSLLLHALQPAAQLYVSDNRASILRNLEHRFRAAGVVNYHVEESDLVKSAPSWKKESFDGIILDAPCSGSGTWGRSPEMMAAFRENRIAAFSRLQETLVKNTLPYLKPGSPLVYITCSVFREENEHLVERVCQSGALRVEEQALLTGYEYRADTMYVARLIKN